jgi:hypothetical protein
LESALSASRAKLKEEQALRRAAEQAQDDADQRLRAMEQSLQTLRDECDDVHEELAFKENELEETRLELEVEKQQLENELQTLRQQLASASAATAAPPANNDSTARSVVSDNDVPVTTTSGDTATTPAAVAVDEGYAQRLEEELELVTEQLIDTEKRLSEAEADLRNKDTQLQSLQAARGDSSQNQSTGEQFTNWLVNCPVKMLHCVKRNSDCDPSWQRLKRNCRFVEKKIICKQKNWWPLSKCVKPLRKT